MNYNFFCSYPRLFHAILFFCVGTLYAQENLQDNFMASTNFPVRVLLDESNPENKHTIVWQLFCSSGFFIEDLSGEYEKELIEFSPLVLTFSKGKLVVNGRKLAVDGVRITTCDESPITYGSYAYEGDFLFLKSENGVYLINSVDIEDYLFSVVRWEGWPGWPDEVNRVFAIMCRTYVVHKVLKERKKGKPFDIKDSNIHQTYRGNHQYEHLWKVLEDTKGIVMTYDGQPIEAMYDACCGGIVPAHVTGYNFAGAPYLKRNYACIHCKKSKLYSWQIEYSLTDFQNSIAKEVGHPITILDVFVSKKDKAGVIQEISVKTKGHVYTLSGKKVYSLFKKIKSLHCDIVKKGKKIIFHNGRGYGHHMGVCQWGVRKMVDLGKSHRDILKYYYVDIKFMNIEVVAGAA